MGVTGMANLAVKVVDLDGACAWYRAAGAEVTDPIDWENARRADVRLGWLNITLFTRAIYEDAGDLPDEGFLHPALFVDDLDTGVGRPRGPLGPAGGVRPVRNPPDRVRGSARRHPPRVHGAAGAPAGLIRSYGVAPGCNDTGALPRKCRGF